MRKADYLFIGALIIGGAMIASNCYFTERLRQIDSMTHNCKAERIVFVRNSDLERFDSIKFTTEQREEPERQDYSNPSMAVPTSGTAAQIAEAVWHSVKGYDFYNYKVVSVNLINDDYWLVEARVPYSKRFLLLEIKRQDGRILRMFDGKSGY